MKPKVRPVVLIIRDGWGSGVKDKGDAVAAARTPVHDGLFNEYPWTLIGAAGESVGLPDGQMGNSEVGHLNMGAGRVVYQEFTRVSKSIRDGDFFKNKAFLAAVSHAKKSNAALHLMGLVSDGGVHSHNTHIYALSSSRRTTAWTACIRALPHGRPRHVADERRGLHPRARGQDARNRRGHGRDGLRALLGDGPRQPLGQGREGVQGVYGGGGAHDDRPGGHRRRRATRQTRRTSSSSRRYRRRGRQARRPRHAARTRSSSSTSARDRAREITRAFMDTEFPHFARPAGLFPSLRVPDGV